MKRRINQLCVIVITCCFSCASEVSECSKNQIMVDVRQYPEVPICAGFKDGVRLGSKLSDVLDLYDEKLYMVEECPYLGAHQNNCGDRCYRHHYKKNGSHFFEVFTFTDSVLTSFELNIPIERSQNLDAAFKLIGCDKMLADSYVMKDSIGIDKEIYNILYQNIKADSAQHIEISYYYVFPLKALED